MAKIVLGRGVDDPGGDDARVLNDARRAFGDVVDAPMLERYAQQAVADLWRDSIKVRGFVPVLALRQIRDMLERREGGGADRGSGG